MRAACHGKGNGASGPCPGALGTNPGTNSEGPEVVPIAGAGSVGTVAAMTDTTSARPGHDTPPPILSLEDLQERYGIGKTKATDLVGSDEFPNSVVKGMHRYPLAALEAWEYATALAGTVAEPSAAAPPAAPATVIVQPPAAGRPGRKPAATKEAA